jgi:hypothetical protein
MATPTHTRSPGPHRAGARVREAALPHRFSAAHTLAWPSRVCSFSLKHARLALAGFLFLSQTPTHELLAACLQQAAKHTATRACSQSHLYSALGSAWVEESCQRQTPCCRDRAPGSSSTATAPWPSCGPAEPSCARWGRERETAAQMPSRAGPSLELELEFQAAQVRDAWSTGFGALQRLHDSLALSYPPRPCARSTGAWAAGGTPGKASHASGERGSCDRTSRGKRPLL